MSFKGIKRICICRKKNQKSSRQGRCWAKWRRDIGGLTYGSFCWLLTKTHVRHKLCTKLKFCHWKASIATRQLKFSASLLDALRCLRITLRYQTIAFDNYGINIPKLNGKLLSAISIDRRWHAPNIFKCFFMIYRSKSLSFNFILLLTLSF